MACPFYKYPWWNVELERTVLRSIDLRASLLVKQNPSTSSSTKRCGCLEAIYDLPVPLAGKIMLWTMVFARLPIPSMSLSATIVCCLLTLLIWAVAVMGLHHLREDFRESPVEGAPSFWTPPEEKPHAAASRPLLSANFRLDLSTEDNYQAVGEELEHYQRFCEGRFADVRADLDYNFHKIYNCQRQEFQDNLIESMLGGVSDPPSLVSENGACEAQTKRNWIVFTAGVMGAGKSYTMKQLHDKGRFPLDEFVKVDPDSVRHQLPEFELYIQKEPETAGILTRKEAGMISEICIEAALRRGQNVLVDGTLRNSTWYQDYFANLRERYPQLQIGILHVTAPREAVISRAMSRAKVTGRVVPRDLLECVMLEVPKSIEILSQQVDVTIELRNPPDAPDVELASEGINWDSFERIWRRKTCPS